MDEKFLRGSSHQLARNNANLARFNGLSRQHNRLMRKNASDINNKKCKILIKWKKYLNKNERRNFNIIEPDNKEKNPHEDK